MAQDSESLAIPPVRSAVPVDTIRGDDEEDTRLLREMAEKAAHYVMSFEWCVELQDQYFGDGVGGIVAVFLFRVIIRDVAKPEWIWVIVGDVPPIYLEFEGFPSPRSAISRE